MAGVVLLGAVARLWHLDAYGFSPDEINKWRAVEAYRHLDFSANAEHPMLMKLAAWASVAGTRRWNAHPSLAALVTVSPEAALRLPNALAGALTTGLVFLLAEMLFDTTVGLWAAFFWATDVNATAINRIGKEDTFLLCFLLLAAYLYERAKRVSPRDRAVEDRWYALSGGAFGLMLASKYMPYYFGIHGAFNIAADRNPEDKTPDKRLPFYAAMGAALIAADFALLSPASWRYMIGYVQGDTMRHTGYDFAGRIYVNTIGASPWGIPPSFYAAFFLTKVSLAVLAAAACGAVWVIRHPSHRGATFLRVFLVLILLPYSFVAGKFLRYMLPALAIVDISAGLGVVWFLRRLSGFARRPRLAWVLLLSAVMATPPAVQLLSAAPFYSLAQNAVGARLFAPGFLFPDDEFYDGRVREAVSAIAGHAVRGAVVCSETPEVVAEYLSRFGRTDIVACSIAHDGLPMHASEAWVLVQPGHVYFENVGVIEQIRSRTPIWLDLPMGGSSSIQVYRLPSPGDSRGQPRPLFQDQPSGSRLRVRGGVS